MVDVHIVEWEKVLRASFTVLIGDRSMKSDLCHEILPDFFAVRKEILVLDIDEFDVFVWEHEELQWVGFLAKIVSLCVADTILGLLRVTNLACYGLEVLLVALHRDGRVTFAIRVLGFEDGDLRVQQLHSLIVDVAICKER